MTAGNAQRARIDDAEERDDGDVGCATADVYHHVASGLKDGQTGANGGHLGVKDDVLASANKFGELLPVSVRRAEKSLTVLFRFIDEGQRSIAKFERFLSTHDKLLCSLPAFEVVYVAVTPELFKEAQHLFGRLFPARPVTHLKSCR